MLWVLYNLLFPIVFLFMMPKFISRMLRRGGYGQHFEQRIGHFGSGTKQKLREHRRIWVHAVSVGEIYVALRFIKAFREACPDACFALSTTTSTGHAIGRKEIDPRDVLFYFPVDLPVVIRKVLRIIDPVRIVLVEGELWPNLIRLANGKGIPVSLINGRMSVSSYKGYRMLKPLVTDVLRCIDPICVQGEKDAECMRSLGAPGERIHVMGTVKFDVAERDPDGETVARDVMEKLGLSADAIVLLGGSTWPGEEEVLCSIYQRLRQRFPNLFLVLVPRHVERAEEVVQCLEAHSLSFVRRSNLADSPVPEKVDALFVNTTGELRNFYAVADIIFVGKSLTEHGGQNPIEPAMYGKAVLVGPNMENFPAVMPVFMEQRALLQVRTAEELEGAISSLLQDAEHRSGLGRHAKETVAANQGVMQRTVAFLSGE